MGTDQDVDTPRFEVGTYLPRLLGGLGAVEILDPHGEIAQALREGAVVLQGEDRRRHQHRYLLAVHGSLERRADRHLGLAEAHVAAHQPVHRLVGLHVLLDGRDGRLLVGGVLPLERRLQLVLQVTVGGECEPFAGLALSIEGDQLARDILDGLLGGVLELLPCPVAEFIDLRRLAVAGLVTRNAVERMDVHEQHVAVLVHQFDGLVHLAVLVDLHQPVETPHAVVDMHHIVARAELVQLGDGHLLVAPDLAVDAVTLVTVENLVVGIEAQFQVVVHEPLVQRNGERPHGGLPAPYLVEDVFEAFDLHLVLREDVGRIAPQRIADHVVGQHLEILVELGLRGRVEHHGHRGGAFRQVVAQRHHAVAGHVAQQHVAAGQQAVYPPGLLHVREHLAAQVVDAAQHIVDIVEPAGCPRTCELHERHPGCLAGIEVGDNFHPVELVGRELARNIETADRVDLVAEKVDPVRLAFRIGKNIDDTTAHGVLPRFVDEIDAREVRIRKGVFQHGDRNLVAELHGNRVALQGRGVDDPFGQRLRIGADHQVSLREAPHGVHRRGALHHALGILGAVGRRTLVGRGEEIDLLLVQQVVKIVQQVGRGIPVFGHEDMHAPRFRHCRRRIKRKSTADQLFQVDGCALLLIFAAQFRQGLRPGGELRQLLAGSHSVTC